MSGADVITESIRDALGRDPRIPHPSEVAVAQQQGVVTLRGSVASHNQRRTAVQIAESVRGVREVEDELRIDPRDRWVDNEIRGAALQALMSNVAVPSHRIEVGVADGWLTLKGDVRHQYDSDTAFESVRGITGVGGITNEIKVIIAGLDG